MALKRSPGKDGQVQVLEHESRVLKGNPLGDPHVRKLAVWLPPQYEGERERAKRFPVLVDMAGYGGSGLSHVAWRSFNENVPERAARLIYDGKMPPVIIVFPDCFTALGGNQYINSSAIGRYADYLIKEIIPFVDREFRTLASREHRGCFGKSSGGYGAIIHGMQYASTWGAIANHSGDSYFDYVYWHDWPNTLNELAKHRAKPDNAREVISPFAVAAIRLLIFTGCRAGEILNLRWANVDLDNGILNLSDSKTGAKKVLLATPATLIALLKAAAYGWRQESVSKNAEEIANLGRLLYDRISGFADHLDKVGRGLETASKSYNSAIGAFEGTVLPGARKFVELGAKGTKELTEPAPVETAPRDVLKRA